jgi:ElaB/YqjD/DUF883 family membrane-anchored ribosome-binding protein
MNTNRTPEQIEANIDDVRERMDSTLDELEHRLNARRMLRDGLAQLSNTEVIRYAASAAASAGRTAREYPVPTALAGVGLLGLVAWGLRARSHSHAGRHSLRDISDAVDSARERLSSARKSLAGSAGSTRRRVRDAGTEAWHKMEAVGTEAGSLARSHPVAAGAIGLVVLAIAAAAATPAIRDRIAGR